MKFRTETQIKKSDLNINHQTKILMIGSCFAQNMGEKLENSKFDILLNPFGVLYNPISIAKALDLLTDRKGFAKEDLFLHRGLYHSFYHHGSFSHSDEKKCLQNINIHLQNATSCLHDANILFVTFGTSYVYEYNETKEVVGNCHKLPSALFSRYRLSVEDIVSQWQQVIDKVRKINPKMSIVFTVSPIRHLRDGAHDNQLSKATLLLAVEALKAQVSDIHYFQSYEILLDDLRDYRFYDKDMVHPNILAIEYIWDIFKRSYFSKETEEIIEEWEKLRKAVEHRPINEGTEEHIHFLKQTLLKLNDFSNKYPFICLSSEIDKLQTQIKDN